MLLQKYVPSSVNMIISALNVFFEYNGWYENKIAKIKVQNTLADKENKELTEDEYHELLEISKRLNDRKLYLILRMICATGVRASELSLITVDVVKKGQILLNFRGKSKQIYIPDDLCKLLQEYIDDNNIKQGSVFADDKGKALDRYNVYSEIKKLCEYTNIPNEKITPASIRYVPKRTYTDQMVRYLTY